MPLMVEPLVLEHDPGLGRYSLSGDVEYLLPLHRQAAELGVDIIKADPTDSVDEYRRMVDVVQGVPLLPRGGGKVSELEILKRTYTLIQAGASGVVYGRNIFQHPNPPAMIRALQSIVHEGATPEQAQSSLE
jgi:DhnA family fructose-bisphosphate aldolase class Ia